MLGLEVRVQRLVVQLDAEMREEFADESRILELFDDPGQPQSGLVDFAKARRDATVVGEVRTTDRSEARAVARLQHPLAGRPLHQRVAPVEQDSAQHVVRLATWRAGSCGDCWCSRPSRSLRGTGCTRVTSCSSCSRRLRWYH